MRFSIFKLLISISSEIRLYSSKQNILTPVIESCYHWITSHIMNSIQVKPCRDVRIVVGSIISQQHYSSAVSTDASIDWKTIWFQLIPPSKVKDSPLTRTKKSFQILGKLSFLRSLVHSSFHFSLI